jgi:hypothetical protein
MEQEQTENFDSTNEELEVIDSPTNEDEQSDDSEDVSDDSEESSQEPYSDREKQLFARMKKAEGFVQVDGKWVKPEKTTAKPVKETKQTPNDELTLTRLEVRGVMEQSDQDYVLRFAKAEGVSALEVLNDPIVKDRLAANKRERESATATPRGNNRASNQVDEVAAAVRKYKQTNELPENNPALTSKILKELKKESEA